ncbi:hypothetical protein C2E23DRAFT_519620 [Lenzites betulinus]|nr:hypothetical protein C2E23DRAFT_519620 [Lenzites betulinus]
MAQKQLLPVDVLSQVALFAERSTLSAMMKTCHALYHEGAKIMVRRRVVIVNIPDCVSFLAFLRAEDTSRCRFLQDLVLSVELPRPAVPNPVSQHLYNLLEGRTFRCLTSLRLDNSESVLSTHTKLASSFSSLTSLTSLFIGPAGVLTLALLTNLKSDLKYLVLKYQSGVDQIHRASELHPVIVLQPFRESLESLEVHGFDVTLDRAQFPSEYPHMQELVLNSPDCPLLAPYIHAFPEVRNLSLTTVFANRLTLDNIDFEYEFINAYRLTNQDEQDVYGTWTKLETVTGTVPDLYLAGFRCAIQVLYMTACTWDPFEMALDVLQDASVSRLHLSVFTIAAFEDNGLPLVFKSLGDTGPDALHLHVRLRAQEEYEDDTKIVVTPDSLNYLLQSLASSPIQTFRFALRCEYTNYTTAGVHKPFEASEGPRVCGAQELHAFDCDVFARQVLETVPAVQDVDVSFTCTRKQRAIVKRNAESGK